MHKSLLSPDTDTFSTPPSTPGPESTSLRASLSRRSSRPSSLLLEEGKSEYKSDILIEESSPNVSRKPNGTATAPNFNRDQPTSTPRLSSSTAHTDSARLQHAQRPLDSPCFVHAFLDKGLSLNDWIRTGQQGTITARSADTKELNHPSGISSPTSAPDSVIESTDEDDEFNGNLTKHLAETAVGVREMSKQLG
jgi:NAD+ kinase